MARVLALALLVLTSASTWASEKVHVCTVFERGPGASEVRSIEMVSAHADRLENEFVRFRNFPSGWPTSGVFCPSTDDPYFNYGHIFYQATRFIRSMNQALSRAELAPLPQIAIDLKAASAQELTNGEASWERRLVIKTHEPVLDTTILIHELAHELHGWIVGQPIDEYLPRDFSNMARVQTVLTPVEGFANLVAEMFTQMNVIGGRAYGLEGGYNLSQTFSYPGAMPTVAQTMDRFLSNPWLKTQYPDAHRSMTEFTKQPSYQIYKETWDPYLASNVFTRPLFQISKKLGREAVYSFLFKVTAQFRAGPTLEEWMKGLCLQAFQEPGQTPWFELLDQELKEFQTSCGWILNSTATPPAPGFHPGS